jgi:hypothetical protein
LHGCRGIEERGEGVAVPIVKAVLLRSASLNPLELDLGPTGGTGVTVLLGGVIEKEGAPTRELRPLYLRLLITEVELTFMRPATQSMRGGRVGMGLLASKVATPALVNPTAAGSQEGEMLGLGVVMGGRGSLRLQPMLRLFLSLMYWRAAERCNLEEIALHRVWWADTYWNLHCTAA